MSQDIELKRRKHVKFANVVEDTKATWCQIRHILYLAHPEIPVLMIAYDEQTGFTVAPVPPTEKAPF